jgi:diguanylate cyclase (GGDEF)-like protein
MMDSHSFVLAGFVSQATFALTLGLLAWSDRRTHGTRWLAAACGLQLAATASRSLLPSTLRASDNIAACLMVLVFFFTYMGLRWFIVRRGLNSMNGPLTLSATMTAIFSLNVMHPDAALTAAHTASLVMLAICFAMLLRPRLTSLRRPARATAAVIVGVMAVLFSRLFLDMPELGLRFTPLTNLSHNATIVCITVLDFCFVGLFVAETKRRLHEETRLDSLTGLRNRRAFEETAQLSVLEAVREGNPLTLLMMDLDHFKKLNDTWGHALGDRALRAFGGVLLTVTASSDAVARLGGEEFAVLLPGRTARNAMAVAERLRATVEGLHLSEGEELVCFTVSIGLSSLERGEETIEGMLRRADRALYQAKRDGRNRVALADALSNPLPPSRITEIRPVAGGARTRPLREFAS